MDFTATLSCKHTATVQAAGVSTAAGLIGDKIACQKCPATKSGDAPQRTIKLVRFDDDVAEAAAAETPAVEVTVNPTGNDEVDAALETLGAELAEVLPAVVADEPAPKGSAKTAARSERLRRAKEAAATGGDAAAVLAEPIPDDRPKRKGGRQAGRVCFLNLSPVRVAALVEAGIAADRLTEKTVDLQRTDVDLLLDKLPAICDADGPNKTAACRVSDWLQKFRQD